MALVPMEGMTIPCDEHEVSLFQASTSIKLGNRKKTLFWQDRWLQGEAPKDIAPKLYKLTYFKKRMVEK
jgi:hypothetical protein